MEFSLDHYPFPAEGNNQDIIEWTIIISDKILDEYKELQRATLFSDALYSAVNTVLFLHCDKKKKNKLLQLTSYDILISALKLFSLEDLKRLCEYSNFPIYKSSLKNQFILNLQKKGISLKQWIDYFNNFIPEIRYSYMKYWFICGFRPSYITEKIIDLWLISGAEFPVDPQPYTIKRRNLNVRTK
jgi:hypothetical protein